MTLKLHKIIAYLMVLQGSLHSAFVSTFYDSFSMDMVWYVGAGFAIVVGGLLNLAYLTVNNRRVLILAIIGNAFVAFFLLLLEIAAPGLRGMVAFLFTATCLVLSVVSALKKAA